MIQSGTFRHHLESKHTCGVQGKRATFKFTYNTINVQNAQNRSTLSQNILSSILQDHHITAFHTTSIMSRHKEMLFSLTTKIQENNSKLASFKIMTLAVKKEASSRYNLKLFPALNYLLQCNSNSRVYINL